MQRIILHRQHSPVSAFPSIQYQSIPLCPWLNFLRSRQKSVQATVKRVVERILESTPGKDREWKGRNRRIEVGIKEERRIEYIQRDLRLR